MMRSSDNNTENEVRYVLASALTLVLAACASYPAPPSVALPSQVPDAIEAQLVQIGRIIDPPRTAALYAPLQQREPYAGVKVARAERFGPDPERNLLDVFTPAANGGAPRPVLVFVHGGGYVAGARRVGSAPFYDNVGLWAVRNGMVAVTTTYRLAPQNKWPAVQEDLAATIAWVRENIAARGGDPNRIYLLGHSAGATHVAQYVGHPRFHVEPGGGIAGAIMLSGTFDPSTVDATPGMQAYFGTDPSVYPRRSALPGMAATRLPLMVAYAELDPSNFHEQAEQAQAALCAAGRCGPLLQLRGHSHMSEVYAINTADSALGDAIRGFVFGRR
jgi:triacylglycerol lipase